MVLSDIKFLLNEEIQNLPPAARLPHFQKNWEKVTTDPSVLSIVEGIKIPFLRRPRQHKVPKQIRHTPSEHQRIKEEVEKMLRKGAIEKAKPTQKQFISNLFLVPKKDGGTRPVINLKPLNLQQKESEFLPQI